MVNDTTRLLGLDGLVVERVQLDVEGVPRWMCLPVVNRPPLPAMRAAGVRVKQWATTRPRYLPVAGRPVRPRWRKRRWYCPTQASPARAVDEFDLQGGPEVLHQGVHAPIAVKWRWRSCGEGGAGASRQQVATALSKRGVSLRVCQRASRALAQRDCGVFRVWPLGVIEVVRW